MTEESLIAETKQEQTESVGATTAVGTTTAVAALRELLRFPMQDPEWRNKFLVGSVLVFLNFIIPILPMLVVGGYALKVMRQAVQGEEPTLPEWDDWGDLLVEGLKGAAVILAYLMPGYVVMFGGIILLTFGQFLILPISAAIGSSGDPEAIASTLLATLGLTFGTVLVQFVLMAVAFIVLLLGLLPLPLALGHYLHEGEVSAGLRLRQVWGLLKVNKAGYLAAWVIYFGLSYVVSLPTLLAYFTLVLICLLPFLFAPVVFYLYIMGAAAFGQHYRESRMMWELSVDSKE
jgi:hypothetical protein